MGRLHAIATLPFGTPDTQRTSTFVPLPPGSAPSTMVSHGGLPTHMVVNPEPNLRPIPGHPPHPRDTDPALNPRVEATTPISMHDSGSSPAPAIAARTEPLHVTARPTIPFPVRSKQRASSTEDPQPKKKQKSDKASTISTTIVDRSEHSSSLPIASAAPIRDLNSDDSDGDAPSAAASAHDNSDNDTNYRATSTLSITTISTSTTPPGTSTLTLTPNPKASTNPSFRLMQPNPADPPRDPPFRPWTPADDQELTSMKQDTKSRPSWKAIGARLHRDPQVCKLRWGILKQTDQHGRVHPLHEPEAED